MYAAARPGPRWEDGSFSAGDEVKEVTADVSFLNMMAIRSALENGQSALQIVCVYRRDEPKYDGRGDRDHVGFAPALISGGGAHLTCTRLLQTLYSIPLNYRRTQDHQEPSSYYRYV